MDLSNKFRSEMRYTSYTPGTDEILRYEFTRDEVDVGHVDLVDETIDTLLQSLPGDALVLRRALVLCVCVGEGGRRNITPLLRE